MRFNSFSRIFARLLSVRAKNQFERQRGQVLAAFLLIGGLLHSLLLVARLLCWISSCEKSFLSTPLGELLALGLIISLWIINRRGWVAPATHATLASLVGLITFISIQVNASPAFVAYAFPIIVASFLLKPTCSFLYASLALIGYANSLVYLQPAGTFDFVRVGFMFAIAGVAYTLSSRFTQAVQDKERSEKKYRNLFERIPVGIYRTTPDGEILEANPALAQMLGYPNVDALLHVNAANLYTDLQANQAWITNFPHDKKQVTVETQFRRLDGSSFWATDSTRAVYDASGNLMYFEGSLIDITERKQAEETLQKSEQEKLQILSITEEMFAYYDLDLRILWANKAAAESANMPVEALIGKHCFEIWQNRNEVCENCPVQLARDTGEPHQAEMATPDGRIWFIRGQAIKDENGRVIALTEFGQNITERKHAEMVQEVVYQIAEAAQTTKTLDDLFPFIHKSIGRLLPADNFYIALYDHKQDLLSFPYFVDQHDVVSAPLKPGKGLTEYVLRTKSSQLITQSKFNELLLAGEVKLVGEDSVIWMGVPLLMDGEAFGVLVIQTYDNRTQLTEKDLHLLAFVSGQIAMAIHRKKAEAELYESRRSMSTLLSNMPGMAYRRKNDSAWTMEVVSEGSIVLTGYLPQDLIDNRKTTYNQIIHPDDRRHVWNEIQQAISKQIPFQLEYRITTAENEEKWVWEQGRCVEETPGKQAILEGFIADITERKQAEMDLQRQATQLAVLNDIAQQIIATHDMTDILSKTVELIQNKFGYHHVSIFISDAPTGNLVMKARAGEFINLFPKEHHLKPGDGMVGWCGKHGKTLLSNNVTINEHYVNFFPDVIPTCSELCVPLQLETKIIGVLDIQSPRLDAFDQNDIQVIETLADQVVLGLENAGLLSEVRQQVKFLNALHTIDLTIASSTDRRMVLNTILEQAVHHLNADAGDFLLFNSIEHTLDYATGIGFRNTGTIRSGVRLGDSLAGQAVLQHQTMSIHHGAQEILPGEKFTCYFGVPLIAKGEVKGVLEIFFCNHKQHTSEWENFLNTLAGQAAIALDNIELFEGLQRSNIELSLAYNDTIEGWSTAVDLRNKESEGHTQRVADMTLRLAARVGVQDSELLHIRRGALLHSIGKIGIPENILFKPGMLTEEEFETVRQHPVYAFMMLSQIAYLKPALAIPYCHQENWDGGGYPRGLRGEQIPLAARIFSIVDVWDALTSDRPYRKAWSKKKALAHIRKQSGKRFDPEIVKAFLELIQEP